MLATDKTTAPHRSQHHAITIEGQGWSYIAPPAGGTGIAINAGFGDKISLRGLILDGTGVGSTGIAFNTALSLTVEDCVVRNLTGDGLDFFGNATTTQKLAVSNSYFMENGELGIFIATENSGTLTASIDRTVLHGNQRTGLLVDGDGGTAGLYVAVTDSVAANNGSVTADAGFAVASDSSISNLSLTRCLSEGNIVGVIAGGPNATLWLAQSTLTGNATSFSVLSSASINSYVDNYITANGAPNGSLTSVGKQ